MNQITSNTVRIKQLNVELVKAALIKQTYGTKLTIANATGLSVATCGNILNELLEKGEVIEIDLERPNGGRPARRFMFNANYCYVACIYLTFEREKYGLTYSVVNLAGERLEENSKALESLEYEAIDQLVEELLQKYPLIKAVGIGVPGVVCEGTIVDHCDIHWLVDFPLEQKLQNKYPVKFIVENDMNLIALGFYRKQDYDEDGNIAVINFPSNNCIGSGIIIDGHVLKGNTNFAGEVSFLPFDMSQEEEIRVLNTQEGLLSIAVKTIVSVIALINPDTVVLTGDLISQDMLGSLVDGSLKTVPKEHMPKILIMENIHDDYMNGLISVTIDSLSYDVQLVKKRI